MLLEIKNLWVHYGRHAELRAQHPGPPPAHGQELEPVHQRPGQQFESPGQDDDGEERCDFAGADVELIRRGNPCILRIHNSRFSLGQTAQRAVFVSLTS